MITEISKGYQITIPAHLRKELGLDIGSPLDMVSKNGSIVIEPIGSDLAMLFKNAKKVKPKKGLTIKEMKKLNEAMFR